MIFFTSGTDKSNIPFTCSKIDEVKDHLENAISYIQDTELYDANDMTLELKKALDVLEDIRKANDALRTWGNEEAVKLEKSEDKIDDLEYKISSLENDVEYLNGCIKSLEEEL